MGEPKLIGLEIAACFPYTVKDHSQIIERWIAIAIYAKNRALAQQAIGVSFSGFYIS